MSGKEKRECRTGRNEPFGAKQKRKADALSFFGIRGRRRGRNGLLASEGLAPVGEAECIRLTKAYENYLRTVREKIGADFSAPYGVTGTVASAFGSDGGADQWTMPLSAWQMEKLGILY